ncbi:MAG: hypothetical protein IKJ22_04430 [Paludibacteraceae bacterium]|jgi:hypothetical protein|nr:hypothetical protein [Paludibacteraceae bacterium]
MKTKKETVNRDEMSLEDFIEMVNNRKHSKTWDAMMRNQGAIICTDPNLL